MINLNIQNFLICPEDFLCVINVAGFSQLFAQQKYEINQYKGLPQNLKINDIVLGDGISSYVATDEGLYYVPSVGVESRSIIPGKYIQSLSDFKNNSFYIGGDNLFQIH